MRTFQQGMLEPEATTLEDDLQKLCVKFETSGQEKRYSVYQIYINPDLVQDIKRAFLAHGWQPPHHTTESEPRTPGDDNIDQYKCPSYFDEDGKLQDCTCGRCK